MLAKYFPIANIPARKFGMSFVRLPIFSDLSLRGEIRSSAPAYLHILPADEVLSSPDYLLKHASQFVLFPGSFNPLHDGHREMANTIRETVGRDTIFELGVDHPVKGRLSTPEIQDRALQFRGAFPLIISYGLPRIIDKMRFLDFRVPVVIGADTAQRFLDAAYYPEYPDVNALAVDLRSKHAQFFVFPRQTEDGFLTCENVVPAEYSDLFIPMQGRWDISSTALRSENRSCTQSVQGRSKASCQTKKIDLWGIQETSDQYLYCYSPVLGKTVSLSLDKVLGMLVGVAIGDALGLPVEALTRSEISTQFGSVRGYASPQSNRFLEGKMTSPGSCSDDTQLTLAVANGLASAGEGLNIKQVVERIIEQHVIAFRKTADGWGDSTIRGVAAVAGATIPAPKWTSPGNTGKGNGICMKVGPLAPYAIRHGWESPQLADCLEQLCSFTHPSSLAVASGLAQVQALMYCLTHHNENFDATKFIADLEASCMVGERYFRHKDDEEGDRLSSRFASLHDASKWDDERLINEFGGGSSYVYNSLPFSHAIFLSNPFDINTLYRAVNIGGDTDSNASMVGALLGALNGTSFFSEELKGGLADQTGLGQSARQFCSALGFVLEL